jgi:WD40 repeat protein
VADDTNRFKGRHMQTRQGAKGLWILAVGIVLGAGQQALGQQVKPSATLRGHTKVVDSLAFSRDGRMLASASWDGTVKLWEVLTGKERATLKGHPDGAIAVAFSPDGGLLASGGRHGMVRLWDTAGRPRGALNGPHRIVYCLSFSPDCKTLAAAVGGDWRLWDVPAGREWLTLRGHADHVFGVAFSADGRMFAGGDMGGRVMLFEAASGKVRASLTGHRGPVWSVVFVPGGRLLASAGSDGTIRVWDVRVGKQWAALKGHAPKTVNKLAAAGKLLASVGDDRTVRLWNMMTRKQVLALKLDSPVWSVAFSPDGKLLAAGDDEGTIRLWSVAKLLAQKGTKEESRPRLKGKR